MHRLLTALAALLAVGLAHADRSVTGRYDLPPSGDAARVARLADTGVPAGRLTLRVGGRFLLEANGSVRHGDYRVEGDRLTLRTEDGETLRGEVDDASVTLEGVVFERPGTPHREAAAPKAEPVVPVAAPLPRPAPVVEAPRPVRSIVPPAPALPRWEARDLVGAWTVRRDGEEQRGERMELRRDGTFRFTMKGASSEGTWSVERGRLVLVYVKADGQPLEEGASGRKEIPVADDAGAFRIDTYRYERATP